MKSLFALTAAAVLSGCGNLTAGLSAVDRTLDRVDRETLDACADLDDPVNAARIDAAALLLTATNQVGDIRERRERFCDLARMGVAQ